MSKLSVKCNSSVVQPLVYSARGRSSSTAHADNFFFKNDSAVYIIMSGIFWNVFSVCYMPSFVIFGKYSGLFPQDSCSFSLHIVMCYLVVKSFVLKNLIHGTEHDTVQYICKPPYVCNNFGHWCVSTKYDFHNCDSNISGKISDKTFPVYVVAKISD